MLEREIAAWDGTEAASVFTSGNAANVGIFQALCTRPTEVFAHSLNHASIFDGIKLAGCKLRRYRHCDMSDRQRRLRASEAVEKLVATDTVFSPPREHDAAMWPSKMARARAAWTLGWCLIVAACAHGEPPASAGVPSSGPSARTPAFSAAELRILDAVSGTDAAM